VDSLREKKKKPLAVLDYVNFISFFPQIVAGPIERRRDLLPQMEGFRLKFTGENAANCLLGFNAIGCHFWLSLFHGG